MVKLQWRFVLPQGLLLAQWHSCRDATSSGQKHPYEDTSGRKDQPPWHNARYACYGGDEPWFLSFPSTFHPHVCVSLGRLRWAEAHHRRRHHQEGHPARFRHVPAPTHEPPSGLRFPGGLLGDHVSPVQIPRAVRQAALSLSSHPQIQPENQMHLPQEVTGEDGGGEGDRRGCELKRQTPEFE